MSIVCHINGQSQYAYIDTEFDFINNDLSYYIELNGVDLSHNNRTYSIPISTTGFDTIKYRFNENSLAWAIMKLRPDTKYQIDSNSCSFYTLEP